MNTTCWCKWKGAKELEISSVTGSDLEIPPSNHISFWDLLGEEKSYQPQWGGSCILSLKVWQGFGLFEHIPSKMTRLLTI